MMGQGVPHLLVLPRSCQIPVNVSLFWGRSGLIQNHCNCSQLQVAHESSSIAFDIEKVSQTQGVKSVF